MGCRDVHAATVLAFLSGTASVAGLLAAVLLPNWRQMRLYTYNKNERNVTIYTGLWIKCARFDGSRDCVIYDPQWYTAVDQLDLRVLQFALPLTCSEFSQRSCEECLKNVSCLWCFTNNTCIDYPVRSILPPSSLCSLSNARWGVCWINFEALIIAIAVVAGIILVSIAVCCCYCCYCRKRFKSRPDEEEQLARKKEKRRLQSLQRKRDRKQKHDEIRKKYGLLQESDNPYSRFENE
uniref:PSI domain-containing protein n=1 Tax=Meleagris gallopavo TaxID=9103 RepID=A0A803YBA1_MELGA